MELEGKGDGEEGCPTTLRINRCPSPSRLRPNRSQRHNPFATFGQKSGTALSFLSPTDLEWMSLNYRKERAAGMSPSKRRMILVMFEEDYQYFPSLREIRD